MKCPNCKTELKEVCVFERVRRFMTITGESSGAENGFDRVLDGYVGKADDQHCVEICCPHCDHTLSHIRVDYEPREGN